MPTPILGNLLPFQKLKYQLLDYQFPKVFGSFSFPLFRSYNKHKLDFYTQKCVFIDYSSLYKGYKSLDKLGRVFVAIDVTFDETEFSYSKLFSKQSSSTLHEFNPSNSSSIHFTFFQNYVLADNNNNISTSAPTLSPTSISTSQQHSSST